MIPELYVLLRSGSFEITAYPTLDFTMPKAAVPNPRVDSVIEERLTSVEPSKREAAKLMWLGQSAFWSSKIIEAQVDISWGKDVQVEGHVTARWLRLYTYTSSAKAPPSDQYFREVLALQSPEALRGLTYLTFRFFADEEDSVWFFSPALKKTRQLTGSNRADAILGSTLSLDDLLVWSGKPEMLEISSTASVTALAPFLSLSARAIEKKKQDEPCSILHQENDAESGARAGSQTATDMGIIGGLGELSQAVFVPRTLKRIDFLPMDPFSLYARQIIYFDSESGLPLYKLVYDRTGSLWKFIIGIAGFAAFPGGEPVPFYSRIISLDKITHVMSIVNFRSITSCRDYPAHLQLNMFDPSKLNGALFAAQ